MNSCYPTVLSVPIDFATTKKLFHSCEREPDLEISSYDFCTLSGETT